ncbi:PAS domain S-box protein [Daejeonella sp. JGW-45]|uniref:PAS domain-containing sensor histidine kinase n=1 Tax=Daejeonella sp. JGW-45 TaxID=3034148 RepID=UPI0023EC2B7E|nr:PAS domain S-box protein [Daejeonella sp. JGW-45]
MRTVEQLEKELLRAKQREEQLSQRVDELSDFVENAAMPIHWVNHNGEIIWVNQAELNLLGYKKEEYIGRSIADFHVDAKAFNDILSRSTANETLESYPAKLKAKDGSVKSVLIHSNVYRREGKFMHIRCLTKDVTLLSQEQDNRTLLIKDLEENETRLRMAMELAAEQISKSENLFKTIVLNIPKTLILIIDRNHRFITVEGDIMERLGYTESSYEGKHPSEVLPPGRYEVAKPLFERALAGEKFSVETKSFEGLDFVVHLMPLRDEKDEIYAALVMSMDITDIKQAEEKGAKLAAIIESSDDAIISKSLEGIITSWNASAQRLFGYTESEVIGKSILMLIPEDRQDEEPLILARLRRGERVEHFETKRITKDKKIIDLSLTISPVKDSKGNIIGFSKIARDITSKKQEEERKNDFIAIVSHELKTPLTSVKSYIQVLLAKAKKEGLDFSVNALTRAEAQTNKMTYLINDFLSLARLEEGKIRLNKEAFTLYPLLEDLASDAQFLAAGHIIELKNCEDIVVNADKDKISQVLINLISNAIKYSHKGSTIIIGCEKHGDLVKVYVSDEGVGISKSDQKRLFERFYRVESEKMKTVSGFGIGLYLVSEILKYHDSKIAVESEEGKGATFWFELKTEE